MAYKDYISSDDIKALRNKMHGSESKKRVY
jgi:hypothetical protein